MKTTKTSLVATGGTTKRPPVSRNGIVPLAITKDTRKPSDLWKDVTATEIGKGFEVVKGAFPDEPKTVLKKARRPGMVYERIFSNKFVHIKGEGSKFVWFEVLPPKPVKTEPPKKRKPINYKNKLTPKAKDKFTKQLDRNILDTASFIMKDLLPKTMSLHSAVERVSELSQQLIDDKVSLPLQYLQNKQLMAVHLRIIRHVADQFELNEEERKLMALEYTRPWSQS
jgi:hypothetical protein